MLGVFGLSNLALSRPNDVVDTNSANAVSTYGDGPGGSGLTPSQIHSIYDAGPVYHSLNDLGQSVSLAVYELAGYTASDVTHFESRYGLAHVPLINKLVLGGATTHNGAGEAELDIELQVAMAQGAKNIQVYQVPNTLSSSELGALVQYRQIAEDNTADVISTSWGFPCEFALNSQSIWPKTRYSCRWQPRGKACSPVRRCGRVRLHGCRNQTLPLPQALQVEDPGNQPYVTSVGGTSFRLPNKGAVLFDLGTNLNSGYPTNGAEGTWLEACTLSACEGSAGGVSRLWGRAGLLRRPDDLPVPSRDLRVEESDRRLLRQPTGRALVRFQTSLWMPTRVPATPSTARTPGIPTIA